MNKKRGIYFVNAPFFEPVKELCVIIFVKTLIFLKINYRFALLN